MPFGAIDRERKDEMVNKYGDYIVDYNSFCSRCSHYNDDQNDYCDECLSEPGNPESRAPSRFDGKYVKERKKKCQ